MIYTAKYRRYFDDYTAKYRGYFDDYTAKYRGFAALKLYF
jgi:hypothetical protein